MTITATTTADQRALLDAVTFLHDATQDGGDVPNRLDDLRARHPGLRIDLLREEEAYDGSVHLDLLLRTPGGPTVSVAVSPGAQLPWPLRGIARAREHDLLEVGGVRLTVQEAIARIDAVFDDRELLRTLVDTCLLRELLAEEPVEVSATQLQVAVDGFRRSRGLHTAAATRAWLDERGLDEERFADMIEELARMSLLRRRVVGDRVAEVIAERATELDVLQVAWVEVAQDEAEPTSPAGTELAVDPLRALIRARRAGRAGELAQWRMADVPAGFEAVRAAPQGTVLAASGAGAAPVLATVVDRQAAVVDPSTVEYVSRRLFDEWLAARRRSATVRWFWGDEARTGLGR